MIVFELFYLSFLKSAVSSGAHTRPRSSATTHTLPSTLLFRSKIAQKASRKIARSPLTSLPSMRLSGNATTPSKKSAPTHRRMMKGKLKMQISSILPKYIHVMFFKINKKIGVSCSQGAPINVKCLDWPETVCSTRYMSTPPINPNEINTSGAVEHHHHQIGETKCEIVSVRICAPTNCGMVPSGTEKCHNKTVVSIVEIPEEVIM